MSKQFLERVLNEASFSIKKKLRAELNLETTVASFSYTVIKKAVYNQIRFTYNKGRGESKYAAWAALTPEQRKEVIAFIDTESRKVLKPLYNEYKRLKVQGVSIEVRGTPDKFTVTTFVPDRSKIQILLDRQGNEYEVGSFNAVRQGYTKLLNELWKKVGDYTQSISGVQDKELSKGKAFNLEHRQGKSVAETTITRTIDKLYNDIKEEVGSDLGAIQVLKDLKLFTELRYLSTTENTKVRVVVGPASANKRQGSKEQLIIQSSRRLIEDALNKHLSSAATWEGSDSRSTIESKKIIKTFENTIKPSKNIRKTKSNTKPKLSNQKLKKEIGLAVNTVKTKTKFKPKVNNVEIKTGGRAGTTNIALAALINARLPQKVIENMKPPALQNRTGRFASSVRVTDVIPTRQGFPSIGYTYQKYPYQTFEPGFKMGSVDRDPRTLIQKSIRQIATELLIGRFYTRRL